jgi:hypothetical protein
MWPRVVVTKREVIRRVERGLGRCILSDVDIDCCMF